MTGTTSILSQLRKVQADRAKVQGLYETEASVGTAVYGCVTSMKMGWWLLMYICCIVVAGGNREKSDRMI